MPLSSSSVTVDPYEAADLTTSTPMVAVWSVPREEAGNLD
jgi:hypothetical protein